MINAIHCAHMTARLKPLTQRKERLRGTLVVMFVAAAALGTLLCFLAFLFGLLRETMILVSTALALGVAFGGAVLYLYHVFGMETEFRLTSAEVADIIESFIEASDGPRDWDEFISISMDDPELEAIRLHCKRLPQEYPPKHRAEYCGSEGMEVLLRYVTKLRAGEGKNGVGEFSD